MPQRATTPHYVHLDPDANERYIAKGDVLADDDPAVEANPHNFEAFDGKVPVSPVRVSGAPVVVESDEDQPEDDDPADDEGDDKPAKPAKKAAAKRPARKRT